MQVHTNLEVGFSLIIGTDVEINGVSLIVFFDDGDDTNNRDIVMFDGNDSNVNNNGFDADGWNFSLTGINYDSGTASMDVHVSDGHMREFLCLEPTGSAS